MEWLPVLIWCWYFIHSVLRRIFLIHNIAVDTVDSIINSTAELYQSQNWILHSFRPGSQFCPKASNHLWSAMKFTFLALYVYMYYLPCTVKFHECGICGIRWLLVCWLFQTFNQYLYWPKFLRLIFVTAPILRLCSYQGVFHLGISIYWFRVIRILICVFWSHFGWS